LWTPTRDAKSGMSPNPKKKDNTPPLPPKAIKKIRLSPIFRGYIKKNLIKHLTLQFIPVLENGVFLKFFDKFNIYQQNYDKLLL
jgi:hypothetical protein